MESGNELVELLWQNGQVVFHSQAHKNPRPTPNESRKVQNPVQSILSGGKPCGNLNCSAQGDETASWIQCPLEDSLEELCSEFFFEVPSSDPIEVTGQMKQFEEGKCIQSGASKATTVFSNSTALGSQTPIAKQSNNPNFTENQMPLHQSINPDALQRNFCLGKAKRSENFCNFTSPLQAELVSADGSAGETVLSNTIRSEVAESSMMTLGSSHCRSNQGPTETDFSWVSSNRVGANEFLGRPIADDVQKMFPPCEREQTDSLEPNLTSSSGGSRGTSGKTCKDSNAINRNKRKGRNKDESEPETGSDEASGSAQRSGSARRRRAAEVHNLSERRRRDRINEKMKALQELIPHCNKTDKASMLDEAIEYLKSLQLQVQIMWIRSGMASATFPSVQHYISQMGIGMGMAPSSIPSIHNPLHFPRVQLLDQAMSMAPASNHPAICSNSISNPVNFRTQMQSTNFFKPYAHCMGFHHMQTAPQPMNRFNFGSQTIQETATLPTSSNGHCSRGTPTSDPTSKMG